jgi:hypothetical protein
MARPRGPRSKAVSGLVSDPSSTHGGPPFTGRPAVFGLAPRPGVPSLGVDIRLSPVQVGPPHSALHRISQPDAGCGESHYQYDS